MTDLEIALCIAKTMAVGFWTLAAIGAIGFVTLIACTVRDECKQKRGYSVGRY
jgi:hypothetical protein